MDGLLDTSKLKILAEKLNEERAGVLFFELAAACRLAKIDPESALRRYTARLMDKLALTNSREQQ